MSDSNLSTREQSVKEEWRPVKGYPPCYEISSMGRFRNVDTGRVLCPYKDRKGYAVIRVQNSGFNKNAFIHRLVMVAFNGEPAGEKTNVSHIDGDISNNRPENLRWVKRTGVVIEERLPTFELTPITVRGEYAILHVAKGVHAKVDVDQWPSLSRHKWVFHAKYVRRTLHLGGGSSTVILLHHKIIDRKPGLQIDHINRDTLDNRKANLRHATHSLNSMNRKNRRSKSRYKGVSWVGENGKWKVCMKKDGVLYTAGRFDDEDDAGRAADSLGRRLWGDIFPLNFPGGPASPSRCRRC